MLTNVIKAKAITQVPILLDGIQFGCGVDRTLGRHNLFHLGCHFTFHDLNITYEFMYVFGSVRTCRQGL